MNTISKTQLFINNELADGLSSGIFKVFKRANQHPNDTARNAFKACYRSINDVKENRVRLSTGSDQTRVKGRSYMVRPALNAAVEVAGCSMPFPQRDVHMIQSD